MSKLGRQIHWASHVSNYLKKVGTLYITKPSWSVVHIRGPKNKTICLHDIGEDFTYVRYKPRNVCKNCVLGADPDRAPHLSNRWIKRAGRSDGGKD